MADRATIAMGLAGLAVAVSATSWIGADDTAEFALGPAAVRPGEFPRLMVYNACESPAEAEIRLLDIEAGEVLKQARYDSLASGVALELGVDAVREPAQLLARIRFRCLDGELRGPHASLQIVRAATGETTTTLAWPASSSHQQHPSRDRKGAGAAIRTPRKSRLGINS